MNSIIYPDNFNMRITITSFLFLLLSVVLHASPVPFAPIVRNYTVSDYEGGIQNWAIAQDENGVMYFGNSKGLLEFDGYAWKLHQLPSKGIVRSIYIANDRRIYVGSYEEFGYFSRTPLNTLEYHSLKNKVKDFKFHNDEIWSIVKVGCEIVFQSFGSLFYYNGRTVEGVRMKDLPLNLFNVGNTCFSQTISDGLCVFKNHRMHQIIPREELGNSDVMTGLPYGDGILFLTRNQGGLIYKDGKITPWKTECDDIFRKNNINRAVITKDGKYVIGTISNGIYTLDKDGRLLWKVNTDSHLQNNTILMLYCDDENNIWGALDEGIAYIHSNSDIYYYEPSIHKIGMIYDVLFKDDNAYIASNQGLYRFHKGKGELIPGLEEQAWFVKEFGNQIFCGHNNGTFIISGANATLISDTKGGMCMDKIDINDRSYLLEGTYSLLNLYTRDDSGRYTFTRSLDGLSHMVRHIEEDHQKNIWAQHLRDGLYRFSLGKDMERVENVRKYNKLGDTGKGTLSLFKINGRVVFSNGERFYTYEDMTDSIVPYETMNAQLPTLKGITGCVNAGGDNYWFVGEKAVYLGECTRNTFSLKCYIPYSLFSGNSIEERASVTYDRQSHFSYLCLNNALARISSDTTSLYAPRVKRTLRISEMQIIDELDGKSEILEAKPDVRVKPGFNTVSFTLCYPVYGDWTYQVRYRLEGYSGQWIEGGRDLNKKFTGLPYGSYVFKAEIYDSTGVLASVELPFEMQRPAYLSYWAIILYILTGLGLICVIQYVIYRYVKKNKDREIEFQQAEHKAELERQEKKIIELEKSQLETDLRFKSKELSSVVMTNIAHQEFLKSLKEEIQEQKLSGQYNRKNLDKLLRLVDSNLVSDEESWSTFQANFDCIHENFFRNLKEKYPDLTSGDLRFCALLRLNMPTKDIAKLLNISTRGVDAARYRLRKKFELSAKENLVHFLIEFK